MFFPWHKLTDRSRRQSRGRRELNSDEKLGCKKLLGAVNVSTRPAGRAASSTIRSHGAGAILGGDSRVYVIKCDHCYVKREVPYIDCRLRSPAAQFLYPRKKHTTSSRPVLQHWPCRRGKLLSLGQRHSSALEKCSIVNWQINQLLCLENWSVVISNQ